MPRPVGQNVTEVELGSPDYTVTPLNSREKRLLKTSSSAEHFHNLFLELIHSSRLVFKDVKRTDEKRWTDVPYMVSIGYGWTPARSSRIFLSLSNYKVRLTDGGAVTVVEKEQVAMKPPEMVDTLLLTRKISFRDVDKASRVLSTVSVQLERKALHFHRRADAMIDGRAFRAALHRWVRKKMSREMRDDLAPLLSRYPAEALIQHLHELVVEEVHDL